MQTKNELLQQLATVEHFAKATKLQRLLKNPFKYIHAIVFRDFWYKQTKKSKAVFCKTFWGTPMHLELPAGTEIYLTTGKAHAVEIKLAKFLIQQLQAGDVFVDVGAHYGYFSLLASYLVGKTGQVFAFEAAPQTFKTLQKNKSAFQQLQVYNQAISNENSSMVFYQFPNLFSEYNTFNVEQFQQENWFKNNPPKAVNISALSLHHVLTEKKVHPKLIKIDVEGAELKVIEGAVSYLKNNNPQLIMEYLSTARGNETYKKAEALLGSLHYYPHLIDGCGQLKPLENVVAYLNTQGLETENIVFKKRMSS